MKRYVMVLGWGAIALLLLTACKQPQTSPVPEDVEQDEISFPEPPSEAEDALQPLPEDVQIYRDENGMFGLALPAGYTYESIQQGIRFESEDGGFGGTIQYQGTATEEMSNDELEAFLRQAIQDQFGEVSWESDRQVQPDGSLRLEWKAMNGEGQQLDALSFIEQHDTTIFILNAHGIGQPYKQYNKDAQVIVGSYVVQENPAGAVPGSNENS